MPAYTLDQILDALNEYRVRATYGAVGRLVDQPASFLMNDLPRTPRNSWIVNKETHEPTGYSDDQKHPDLRMHSMVLEKAAALQDWLDRKAAKSVAK